MAWKVFEARKTTPATMAVVAIQGRGAFSVNRKGHELLTGSTGKSKEQGKDIHVELLYDETRRAVGIRVAQPGNNTYPLRKQPRSESFLISAKAFLRNCGIDLTPQRYVATLEGNILMFSLDQTKVKKQTNN